MITPTVSVIMPAHNHERYVGEAIDSVLNQTFTDFEFIIINDGSTDGTDRVIKTYDDPRIRYYPQENIGAPDTLNRALSLAQGKYISIINSDDVYRLQRLLCLVEKAEAQNAKFIFTDLEFVDESTKNIDHPASQYVSWLHTLKSNYNKTESLERTFLFGNIAVTSSNFFFHSRAIEEIGQFNSYRYVHDYDFALRNLLRYRDGFQYITDKKYLLYRLHKTNTIKESHPDLRIEVFDLLIKMLPEFMRTKSNKAILVSIKDLFVNLHDETDVQAPDITEMMGLFTRLISMIRERIEDPQDKALVESALERLELLNVFMGMENTIGWKISAPVKWLYHRLPLSLKISAPVRWLYVKYLELIKH